MLKITLKNEVKLNYPLEDGTMAVFTLRKPFKEEVDYSNIAQYFYEDENETDEEKRVKFKDGKVNNFINERKRKMLVGISDNLVDEEGNQIKLYDEDNKINEEVQKSIYEFLTEQPNLSEAIDVFYDGDSSLKN